MQNPTAWGISLTLGILAFQGVIWGLIFWRIRRQAAQMVEQATRTDETLIFAPEFANYQGWSRKYGIARTMGRLALTDRRIWFKRPFGADIMIPLSAIEGVSGTATATAGKYHHDFRHYLSLTLRDKSEVLFLVRDQGKWLEALQARISSVAGPAGL